jgi:uncharacterized protein YbjT (DUF2867 family)
MRILLTGASGFIGERLQITLLARGHHLVCPTREPRDRVVDRLSYIHADFTQDTEKSIWLPRLRGVDVVINAVGIFRERGSQTFALLHTDTPCALFKACAELGSVQLVIQISALGADEDADTAYHLSKKAADDCLAGLPLYGFIVQPSLVYGKAGVSARALKTVASMPFSIKLGSSEQLVQPIHVDDVVDIIASLIHQPLPLEQDSVAALRIALVGPLALPFIDYLATLRAGMGLGPLHTLRVPEWAARLVAQLRLGWLDPEALRMLERGNTGDPAIAARLLGRALRDPRFFIDDPAAEGEQAKLGWLLPILRISIAVVWITTAIVSAGLYPVTQSYALLERTGLPVILGPLMLYGSAGLDLLMGLGSLFLARRRWLWLIQLGLIGFYSLVIVLRLPEFLLHPYGPLTKNVPMLIAIWMLYELEEK